LTSTLYQHQKWTCIIDLGIWPWSGIYIHCDSIITRSSGSTGKTHVITDRVIYTRDRCSIKCPTHRHFVWDISQCI